MKQESVSSKALLLPITIRVENIFALLVLAVGSIGLLLLLRFSAVLLMRNIEPYAAWNETGAKTGPLLNDGKLDLAQNTERELTEIMRSLANAWKEPTTDRISVEEIPRPFLVREEPDPTDDPDCTISYSIARRSLCSYLLRLPAGQKWGAIPRNKQRLLIAFSELISDSLRSELKSCVTETAQPGNGDDNTKSRNQELCYASKLARRFRLPGDDSNHKEASVVTPLVYLVDDQVETTTSSTLISFPRRIPRGIAYAPKERAWYIISSAMDRTVRLDLGDKMYARCAITDPYGDKSSTHGQIRSISCWPETPPRERFNAAGADADQAPSRPPYLLAIDLWWSKSEYPSCTDSGLFRASFCQTQEFLGSTIYSSILVLNHRPYVTLGAIIVVAIFLYLSTTKQPPRRYVYLVREHNILSSESSGANTDGVKHSAAWSFGSASKWLQPAAGVIWESARANTQKFEIDYRRGVRGIESWCVYSVWRTRRDLLGLSWNTYRGALRPQWRVKCEHLGMRLPRFEYHPDDSDSMPKELIELCILENVQQRLVSMDGVATVSPWQEIAKRVSEIDTQFTQSANMSAGRFYFNDGGKVARELYEGAEVQAVVALDDLLEKLENDEVKALQGAFSVSLVVLCRDENDWKQRVSASPDLGTRILDSCTAGRRRDGIRLFHLNHLNSDDRVSASQMHSEFAILDKGRFVAVFEESGYITQKPADVRYYRTVFELVWDRSISIPVVLSRESYNPAHGQPRLLGG